MLKSGALPAPPQAPAAPAPARTLFGHTYMVTALNPKGLVFFVAFLPQFVHPGADAARQLWLLAATFIVLSTLNATLYATFAGAARRLLDTPKAQRNFHFAGGALLTGAGVWALLARRPG